MVEEEEGGGRLRIGPWVPDPFRVPRRSGSEDRDPEPVAVRTDAPQTGARHPVGVDEAVGRRRRATESTGRRWLVVATIVAGIGATVAVPLLWSSLPSRPGGSALPVTSAPAVPGDDGATSSPSPATTESGQSSAPSTKGTRAFAFAPVTYEAEAPGNDLGGTASVADYPGASGGRIVQNIGEWRGPHKDGWLRFTNVTVPATATYLLTFFYVNPDDRGVRSTVITVSGSTPITVPASARATCCGAARQRITLKQGANAITFTNPTDQAPSIDKIVVSLIP
jgi:hypothetical protein